ncbi:hypothetical protein L208DRAFT_1286352 [Tricholoma matsutake]|nr:hypothetical protein L208DRAFT_1286352 [Tricholoma matsutake 945]
MQEILALNQKHPELSLQQILWFITLALKMKNDIILAQPTHIPSSDPPDILPPSITLFLGNSCGISEICVTSCWEALRSTVWYESDSFKDSSENLDTLYPPHHTCTNASCPWSQTGKLLKQVEQRQGVLYTFAQGAQPICSVHLYLCNMKYHHNLDGTCTYYDGAIPDAIQVGEHQFAEQQLIQMWITSMLLSWTSATNCTHQYNHTLAGSEPPVGWPFGFAVTTEQVWDGFIILALLEDCQQWSKVLEVPHTGAQKDRFTAALRWCNLRFHLHGQPESQHYCHKCLCIYKSKKVWVCVIDGVTVGCPCCAVHNCKVPLENNRHCFCPRHSALDCVCSVVSCSATTAADSRMCSDPEHQEAEQLHRDWQQAHFQLKERLQCARVTHPSDAVAQDVNVADLIDADEEEDLEIAGHDKEGDSAAKNPPKRICVQLSHKQTHNEQIIVAPCGMIIAHESFYGAEGIGSIIEMIKCTFHEDIKPDHIFFDNNCSLAKAVQGKDLFFDDIGLTVDVFHFKAKHSETDLYCQQYCNPIAYPELLSEDGKEWHFNSSIAEQTNVWLGGYHAMCHEMLINKYTFFLDELILHRNRMTREKLTNKKWSPSNWLHSSE